jgi:hypothetical protein
MSSAKITPSATVPVARLILSGPARISIENIRKMLNDLFRDPEQPDREIFGHILRDVNELCVEVIRSSDNLDDLLEKLQLHGHFSIITGPKSFIQIREETPAEMAEWYQDTCARFREQNMARWTKNPDYWDYWAPSESPYIKWTRYEEDVYQENVELMKRVIAESSFEPRLSYQIDKVIPNHFTSETVTLLGKLKEKMPPESFYDELARAQIEETRDFIKYATQDMMRPKNMREFCGGPWAAIFEWNDLETQSLVEAWGHLAYYDSDDE